MVHLPKVDLADHVLVIDPGGYVDDWTRAEFACVQAEGKPVSFTDPESPTARLSP